jgi:hypothetical protein
MVLQKRVLKLSDIRKAQPPRATLPLHSFFLTQRVGTTLCLRTGLMMIETGVTANSPSTVIKIFAQAGGVAFLHRAHHGRKHAVAPLALAVRR